MKRRVRRKDNCLSTEEQNFFNKERNIKNNIEGNAMVSPHYQSDAIAFNYKTIPT